ncbi:hypothetical protein LCGC14_2110960 [marine sediment metagenome]|uniref:Uncharacterized protein n=1 Tax=marine sediment metagenome TaxID=412755 RepID=A0A0F9E761_9ZZZZ
MKDVLLVINVIVFFIMTGLMFFGYIIENTNVLILYGFLSIILWISIWCMSLEKIGERVRKRSIS